MLKSTKPKKSSTKNSVASHQVKAKKQIKTTKKRSITTKSTKQSQHFQTPPQHLSTSSFSTQSSPDALKQQQQQQNLPKIPKLSYLKYDKSTDILGLLKSRGFINQTTSNLERHFNSTVDLSPESITSCLAALSPSQDHVMAVSKGSDEGNNDEVKLNFKATKMPVYKTTQNDNSGDSQSEDISTPRNNTGFNRRAVYAGFDPTAASLHLGNLLVILSLMHFSRAGHQVVALTGGATGMVGDPSGRSTERVLQSSEQVKSNVDQINTSLLRLLQLPTSPIKLKKNHSNGSEGIVSEEQFGVDPIFVNNYDWYQKMSVIDFLRDIGKHFRVATMLSKDSVKSRMSTDSGSGDGISFTEFSYQALQGHDFNHLNQQHNVTLQIGGSDQWGNITAGIDCIHRNKVQKQQKLEAEAAAAAEIAGSDDKTKSKDKKKQKSVVKGQIDPQKEQEMIANEAHGLTLPLLTTSQGVKFGKSMGNAIWINPSMTSSYQMYQYLKNTNDLDCCKFLNVFTFLSSESIDLIMSEHEKLPDARIPQSILACEIVRLLHGDVGVKQALAATKLLFSDKFNIDMSHYTKEFTSVEEFEQFESRPTYISSSTPISSDEDVKEIGDDELVDGLGFDDYLSALEGVPITHLPSLNSPSNPLPIDPVTNQVKPELHPYSIVNLAVSMKLCASKSEAKRLIKNNGLSLFKEKVTDENFILTPQHCQDAGAPFNRIIILKSGQKKVHIGVLPAAE